MGHPKGLTGPWRVHHLDGRWIALPMGDSMWTVDTSCDIYVGPIGTKGFDTQAEAMNYAYDGHVAYLMGWMP